MTAVPAAGGQVSLPVDCLPDHVVQWNAGDGAEDRFGAGQLPGIVLGPPGASSPSTGATSVASLGHGGQAILSFADVVIEDRPGPDFIIFENAFFVGAPPADPGAPFLIFAEPATVEVSMDGDDNWFMFPFDAEALAATQGTLVDEGLYGSLRGLAGVTPTFTGNWLVADDPDVWDADGTGGVSGAGGDAFDLAQVGMTEVRFLRITDGNSRNGAAGAGEGFDLDAVVALHARPWPQPARDRDGDGLNDEAEAMMYGTPPDDADSDGDGLVDGRERAGCQDPASSVVSPAALPEPALVVRDAACADLRWTWPGAGATVDLLRGQVSQVTVLPATIDLGWLDCLADDQVTNSWLCDSVLPPPGDAFFYVVDRPGVGMGRSSDLVARSATAACP